jgi:hypothetical protein
MKTCTNCGHSNKDEAKFCGACGVKLGVPATLPDAEHKLAETICPVCGSKNRPGVHFCGYCGANLWQISEGGPALPPPPGATPAPMEGSTEPSLATPTGQPGAVDAAEPAPASLVPAQDALSDALIAPAPEPVVAAAPDLPEPKPAVTCVHCGAVIRYCPCCGQPLFDVDLSAVAS